MQKKSSVHIINIVEDDTLKDKEETATATFRKFFPDAPPVKLYRTSGGKVGMQVAVSPRDPKFDDAYQAVLRAIGEVRIMLKRVIHSQEYHPCTKYLDGINALLSQLSKDKKLSLEDLSECLEKYT